MTKKLVENQPAVMEVDFPVNREYCTYTIRSKRLYNPVIFVGSGSPAWAFKQVEKAYTGGTNEAEEPPVYEAIRQRWAAGDTVTVRLEAFYPTRREAYLAERALLDRYASPNLANRSKIDRRGRWGKLKYDTYAPRAGELMIPTTPQQTSGKTLAVWRILIGSRVVLVGWGHTGEYDRLIREATWDYVEHPSLENEPDPMRLETLRRLRYLCIEGYRQGYAPIVSRLDSFNDKAVMLGYYKAMVEGEYSAYLCNQSHKTFAAREADGETLPPIPTFGDD